MEVGAEGTFHTKFDLGSLAPVELECRTASSGWTETRQGPGGVQARCLARGVRTCPRLTVELLSEECEEDREVDGALPLLQHGVQLLFWDAHLPWQG